MTDAGGVGELKRKLTIFSPNVIYLVYRVSYHRANDDVLRN